MNNIENTTRSGFFPNAKGTQSKKAKQLNKALLQRNDVSKANELKSVTAGDAKVTIPDAIKDFSRIKKAVDAAPPVDNSDKIMELKNKIASGSYKVDYDALADKILKSEF